MCTQGYCDCRTLAQYLSRLEKDMEEREILIIFQQMLSALKYIHVNNILHRCAAFEQIVLLLKSFISTRDGFLNIFLP